MSALSLRIKEVTTFFQFRKVPSGIYPLGLIMVGAVSGGSYFAYHCLMGPEIALDRKHNPHPNMNVRRDETHKFYDYSGTQPKRWNRFQSYKGESQNL
ncbi:hypothetical protein HDV06_002974 [Boothiomyces sp. JEL0866]|nr:hypothetical protein HDV06_002974 [Boothiomyces sp. JEL0866]